MSASRCITSCALLFEWLNACHPESTTERGHRPVIGQQPMDIRKLQLIAARMRSCAHQHSMCFYRAMTSSTSSPLLRTKGITGATVPSAPMVAPPLSRLPESFEPPLSAAVIVVQIMHSSSCIVTSCIIYRSVVRSPILILCFTALEAPDRPFVKEGLSVRGRRVSALRVGW